MSKTFKEVKNTIDEQQYKDALDNFLATNGADLSSEEKSQIVLDPDRYVLFSSSEDGLEVSLKKPA